jgi:hypothetical protein
MSKRALAFLEEWTSDNIDPEDFEDEAAENKHAKELADRFLAAAAAAGIPKAEIDDVVDDLTSFMAEQIDEANEREEDDEDDDVEEEVKNEIEDEADDEEEDEDKEHKS